MTKKTTKRPGLGAALATSLRDEKQSIDQRFHRAESLFQEKEQKRQEESMSAPNPQQPPRVPIAPEKPAPAAPKKLPVQEKVKRDTFTFPPADYKRIQDIQKDCLRAAIQVNKSEVVRAGLIALQELTPEKRHQLLQSVEKMKPGRPVV
jgi:hypothetical protein